MFSYTTLDPYNWFLIGIWVGYILYGAVHFWEKHDKP